MARRPTFRPPSGAEPADLPAALQPELATLVDRAPAGAWVWEIKFDGYRMLARIEGQVVQLLTRNGNDWTDRLLPLRDELNRMKLVDGWYDGEIVVTGPTGVPDFNALQNAFDNARTAGIQFYVFDAPFLAGHDLRRVPVEDRRAALKAMLPPSKLVRFSEEFTAPAGSLIATACQMGLEGIIGKRKGSPYVTRRSDDWVKLKCTTRQEFVIGGYTQPDNFRIGIGALLVGYFDDDNVFQYAGKVGTGFTGEMLAHLRKQLDALAQPVRPFATATGHDRRATWVRPEVVCEVTYGEWRDGGSLRHASFKGLRQDKIAAVVRREVAAPTPPQEHVLVAAKTKSPIKARAEYRLPKVTHGSRVIDPSTGLTKLDLVRYYAEVSRWALPHLQGRHIFIRRAPDGVVAPTVFQEHPDGMPGLKGTDTRLWPGHEPAISIETADDLVNAAQAGMIELHTWNSTARAIKLADRLVFDIDPGEGVTWKEVQEAALLVRAMLDELGLESWLKTSGGKGLHVVVPVIPEIGHAEARAFTKAVVDHMARTIPQRFVVKSGSKNRVGKIFIDYLRNGQSQTTVAAYSSRTRPGMGVSMPVSWGALPELSGGAHWDINSAVTYLAGLKKDLWAEYWNCKQSVQPAIEMMK